MCVCMHFSNIKGSIIGPKRHCGLSKHRWLTTTFSLSRSSFFSFLLSRVAMLLVLHLLSSIFLVLKVLFLLSLKPGSFSEKSSTRINRICSEFGSLYVFFFLKGILVLVRKNKCSCSTTSSNLRGILKKTPFFSG